MPWEQAAQRGSQNLTVYQNSLRVGYIAIAKQEAARNDWENAYYFGSKALAVTHGDRVDPQPPSDRKLALKDISYLNTSYHLLLKLRPLKWVSYPLEMAVAQVQYDCWLEEEEAQKFYKTDHANPTECYDSFIELLSVMTETDTDEEDAPTRYEVTYKLYRRH
jgi:hypothetical protein